MSSALVALLTAVYAPPSNAGARIFSSVRPLHFKFRELSITSSFVICSLIILAAISDTARVEVNAMRQRDSFNAEYDAFPTYYINLARRPDRDVFMQYELIKHGIVPPAFSVHRFNAVDGTSHVLTPAERRSFATFDAAGRGDAPNARFLKANALSHLGVWRTIAASNVSVALVLQDDASLRPQGFQSSLKAILDNIPSDAWIVWVGLNAYASGPVSRSSPLDPTKYDPNFYSSPQPPGNTVVGVARPGLTATGTLAYLITSAGANALAAHFGSNERGRGWSHHTDHDLVALLDAANRSYISRELLATTHADGALGSDVFFPSSEAAECAARVERWIRDSFSTTVAGVSDSDFAAATTLASEVRTDIEIENHRAIRSMNILLEGLHVRVEEAACLTKNCAGQPQTTAFLSWPKPACSGTAFTDFEEPSVNKTPVEHPAFRLNSACTDVAAADVVNASPAIWTLEAWAAGNHRAPHTPRPRFAVGQAVECRFILEQESSKELDTQGLNYHWSPWEAATVVAVGYREESWAPNVHATYVVRHSQDGRLLVVARDEEEFIRMKLTDLD